MTMCPENNGRGGDEERYDVKQSGFPSNESIIFCIRTFRSAMLCLYHDYLQFVCGVGGLIPVFSFVSPSSLYFCIEHIVITVAMVCTLKH